MTDLVALDVGGTHARFALATVGPEGVQKLGEPETLKTSDFASLKTAWEEFERRSPGEVPKAAAIAIAAPVTGETVRMTNNSWVIHTGRIEEQLGIDEAVILNDFGAVAHAVARAEDGQFIHLTGPEGPLPASGTLSVVGVGTGLGVAHLWRDGKGGYHVQATEGGHVDFAPIDAFDDAMMQRLRKLHRRVSTERVVSGPGLSVIYHALAAVEGRAVPEHDDKTLWELALSGDDSLASAAAERFCLSLGSVCGDYALAHGASAVVLAGGLAQRLKDTLLEAGFAERFRFKGRYEQMMSGLPVKLLTHPQPGLFGAAAAFAREHFK